MNKKLYSLVLTMIFTYSIYAQTQSISLQPSYTNQSFYSMENGEVANVDNADWDLAFSTGAMSSSIRINGGMGTELYLYPLGDTTDWNAFNSSNISSWTPIHNSDTNWFIGAFDKNSTSMFDMGWGMYSIVTHFVTGDSIYAIKTVGGNWKKLWIKQLANGEYDFQYANLDGSNQVNTTITQSFFSDRNFAYYSLDQNTSLNREPASEDWDITFTKYITPVQGMTYSVAGVLSNSGVQVAQVDNLPDPNTYTDYTQHTMMTEIDIIGHDWKDFDMSIFSYVLDPNRCYFVKDLNDRVWRIVFTSFEGSSTGIVEFNTQEMTGGSTSIINANSDVSTFEIFPNPIVNNDITIIYDNLSDYVELEIYDMTGKSVFSDIFYGAGFQAKRVNTSNLKQGVYVVRINSQGTVLQKKLVVN
ncbi:MAG: T9SS type A sorting domain-containing protein [Flavobacteriales bacterium]|nr:T9SS type A sorting domain-containing protein [Flavobacteriales bacterium]